MYSKYPSFFLKGQIGQVEIRNRIVMTPWVRATVRQPRDSELIDFYAERAKGGVGMIITETNYQSGLTPLLTLAWAGRTIPTRSPARQSWWIW